MKPKLDTLAIVTATTDLDRSEACRLSWQAHAAHKIEVYVVANGGRYAAPYLGTVPAFADGVARALQNGHEIIACFHDDLLIEEEGWDAYVLHHFDHHRATGLVGFLGGNGLGDSTIYQTPYSPHQLARQGVMSNERNAEAHGARVRGDRQVAVLDGFSQIGRRAFWGGWRNTPHAQTVRTPGGNLFAEMAYWGITHHAYDAALGCFAARLGWEVWMLPVACWHQGGQTAVGDQGYQRWAKTQTPDGDQGFWEAAHKMVYAQFRDVLPIRVGGR